MLDVLFRSIARAGGVEMPDGMRVIERSPPRPSILRRFAGRFERWNVRRSAYLTLNQLDDRMLKDIGLHRSMLRDVVHRMESYAAANDNTHPVALADVVANDNEPSTSTKCI